MKKIHVQEIPNGDSNYEYSVRAGDHLMLLLLAIHSVNAKVNAIVRLVGKGARATIVGIIVGKQTSNISLHTLQHHQAPETTSNLLVKTVLTDKAVCRYHGGIVVEQNAQKTDAYQRNENLLLSPHAFSESKPSLEILANDVRCTHGATVGNISEDQLWYLQSRGIAKMSGETLIVNGFLESALERIEGFSALDAIRSKIRSLLA